MLTEILHRSLGIVHSSFQPTFPPRLLHLHSCATKTAPDSPTPPAQPQTQTTKRQTTPTRVSISTSNVLLSSLPSRSSLLTGSSNRYLDGNRIQDPSDELPGAPHQQEPRRSTPPSSYQAAYLFFMNI